jgi:hypothetical protein
MSVRPVTFNADGSIDVVFDDVNPPHSGTIPAAEVMWGAKPDGSHDHNTIVLNCPDGCGATSTHPVGGGAAPAEVQQMFVEKTEAEGCACGTVEPSDPTALPESHVRLNVNRMDGIGRWQLDTPTVEGRENAPDIFQVVYRKTDRLVLGLEPAGGVGPDNSVAVIHDMAEYDVLVRTDPAYLSADGEHIVGSPP